MQQPAEYSLEPIYRMLNLDSSADEQKVRTAYIHLCRFWGDTTEKNWISMGLDPKHPKIELIYLHIKLAFIILTNPNSRESYLKGEMRQLTPLDKLAVEFKDQCESQYNSYLQSKPKETVEPDLLNSLIPEEIFLLIMMFLDNKSLARLARSSGIYHFNITRFTLLWKRLIESRDKYELYRYFNGRCPLFVQKGLEVIFSPEIAPSEAEKRLMPYSNMAKRLADDAMNFALTPLMQREGFRSTAAYFWYLMSNVKDYFITTRDDSTLMNPDDGSLVVTDESGKTLKQIVTGNMSVFQVLTTVLPYSEIVHHNLAGMIGRGARLPPPFMTKENFQTTASYFQYLIFNAHDLYIALHNNPKLINEQDENGQTLLFYPVIAAQCLSRIRLKWIMKILTSVPDLKLDIVDSHGDTCVHWTTRNCTEVFHNKEGLASVYDNVIFDDVFLPLIDFAKEKKFNFESLDINKMSVLHIAANLPKTMPNAIFTLLYQYQSNSNLNPNQLSGEGYTALYYVINLLKIGSIEDLVRETSLNNSAGNRAVLLLQETIFKKCQKIIKDLSRVPSLYSEGLDFDMRQSCLDELSSQLHLIRKLHQIFTRMVCKIKDLPPQDVESDWLTPSMVLKILDKSKEVNWYNNALLSKELKQSARDVLHKLSNPNASMYEKMGGLWDYVERWHSENSPLLNVILEVFKDELEREIIFIHDDNFLDIMAKDEIPPKSAKDMNIEELTKLISVKLLKMKSLAVVTNELGDFFNEMCNEIPMRYCNALFEFLLTHRVHASNTSSMWQESVNRYINWPVLIENIRAKAMEKLKGASECMGYDQAISYLQDCRSYPIFNLPNSLAEKVGRTYAVVEIDNLIQQRESERAVTASKKLGR